jgi:tetratricopeptide (TPR) repeat protein
MKKLFFISKLFIIFVFTFLIENKTQASNLQEGIDLFNEDKFEKSKFLFEKNLVFNPKSEESYLYLAKIFSKKENENEQEKNLNSVLLLNPKNEEAIYMLTLLKIKQSNYDKAKELIEKFNKICKNLCLKKTEIDDKLKKLNPDNEKNNN